MPVTTKFERIPIIGWWSQRRLERFFGPKFWLRPILVEVCFGLATAALYWMEIEALGLEGQVAATA